MKFLADDMLGRLAKWLRILGYDTLHLQEVSDDVILRRTLRDRRILLTRDRELAGRAPAHSCLLIRNIKYLPQVREVIKRVPLKIQKRRLFSICLECNIRVRRVVKRSVQGQVPAGVYGRHRFFWRCPKCFKVFWRGSHYENTWNQIK